MPAAGRNTDGGPKCRRLAEMPTAGQNADGESSHDPTDGSSHRSSTSSGCRLKGAVPFGQPRPWERARNASWFIIDWHWAPKSIFPISDPRQPDCFSFDLHFLFWADVPFCLPANLAFPLVYELDHSASNPCRAPLWYRAFNLKFFKKISGFYNAYAKND